MLLCVNVDGMAEVPSKAALYCPLEIVEEYPPNAYLYFCDYLNPDCNTYQGANYFFGSLAVVPYQNCPGDCGGALKAKKTEHSPFTGREARVPLNYMHEPPVPRPDSPTPPGTPGPFQGPGVNKDFDAYFVKFIPKSKEVYAKVIELRVRARPQDATRRGLPGGPVKDGWRSIFVAFEVDANPADSGYPVHPVISPQQSRSDSVYVWSGRIMLEVGKSAPVLILLAKESP
jgi:hypothetical protein